MKNKEEREALGIPYTFALGIYVKSELASLLSYTSYLSAADKAVQLSPNSRTL
jgi:hypothetical protein